MELYLDDSKKWTGIIKGEKYIASGLVKKLEKSSRE